jgi:hypothetical protein
MRHLAAGDAGGVASVVANALGSAWQLGLSFVVKLVHLNKLGDFIKKIWDGLKKAIDDLVTAAVRRIPRRKTPKKRCKKCKVQGPGKPKPPKKSRGGSVRACVGVRQVEGVVGESRQVPPGVLPAVAVGADVPEADRGVGLHGERNSTGIHGNGINERVESSRPLLS